MHKINFFTCFTKTYRSVMLMEESFVIHNTKCSNIIYNFNRMLNNVQEGTLNTQNTKRYFNVKITT